MRQMRLFRVRFDSWTEFFEEVPEHIAAGILLLGETKTVFLRFPAVVVNHEHDLIQLLFLELVQALADAGLGTFLS